MGSQFLVFEGFWTRFMLGWAVCLFALQLAAAQDGSGDDAKVDFQRHVLPLLADRCFKCHGPDSTANDSGLRLDVRESAVGPLPIGDGSAIVPGKPNDSELIARVSAADESRMPPEGSNKVPLNESEIAMLRNWIAAGANYDSLWSFQRLPHDVVVPLVANDNWSRNEIDHFVLRMMREQGFAPSSESERWRLASPRQL